MTHPSLIAFVEGDDWRTYAVGSVVSKLWLGLRSNRAAASTGCVSLLLDRGADPDALGPAGETALLLAIDHGQLACARALLDRGADPDRGNQPCLTVSETASARACV